jgi:two-component system nitrogen regulation response regulator GlnG
MEAHLPPLRERAADIPLLAQHFLDEVAAEAGPRQLTAPALAALSRHSWPGNVRELRNVIRGAALLTESTIEVEDLELGPPITERRMRAQHAAEPGRPENAAACPVRSAHGRRSHDLLDLTGRRFVDMEQEIYRWALRENGGSRRRAAHALGISRSTFCDRVKRLRLGAENRRAARPDPPSALAADESVLRQRGPEL